MSRKRLVVRFLAVKSPPYLTENFAGGQLPPVLWRWPIDLMSPKKINKTILDITPRRLGVLRLENLHDNIMTKVMTQSLYMGGL